MTGIACQRGDVERVIPPMALLSLFGGDVEMPQI